MTRWSHRIAIGLCLALVLGFALRARVVPAVDVVLDGDEVRLLGADSYYHLRHTRFAVEHFPTLQRWDIGTHYPTGERSRTTGLYDLAMAGAALTLGAGHPNEDTIRTVMAWTPPILALFTVLALFALVRRVVGSGTALLALWLVTLYPGSFLGRTLLGFADHHAAEVLLTILMALGAVGLFRGGDEGFGWRSWGRAAIRILPFVLLVFTWLGALVYLTVLAIALFATIVVEVARGAPVGGHARRTLRYGLAGAAMLAAIALLRPNLVLRLSLLWLTVGACLLLACVPLAYVWTVDRLRARGWSPGRVVLATGLAVAAVVVLIVSGPSATRQVLKALATPKNPWVSEHIEVTPTVYWESLGWPGLLALGAPVVAVALGWRDEARVTERLVVLFAGLMLGLWVLTHDYEYLVPPLSAVSAAIVLKGLASRLRLLERPRRAVLAGVATAIATLVPVWPVRAHRPPWSDRDQVDQLLVVNDAWHDAMAWLSARTPEPSLPVDSLVPEFSGGDFSYPEGAYGVVNAWDFGNFVAALGHRSTVASQGVSTRAAQWMFIDDEDAAIDWWSVGAEPQEHVRYVVIDADTLSDHLGSMMGKAGRGSEEFVELVGERSLPVYNDAYNQSIASRLYHGAGSGLGRHRLVFQTRDRSLFYYRAVHTAEGPVGRSGFRMRLHSDPLNNPTAAERYRLLREHAILQIAQDTYVYGAELRPSVRVFEIVTGARLRGRAAPGSTVEVQLDLRSSSDNAELHYRQSVTVDDDGGFELRLPHTTDDIPYTDVVADGLYRVLVLAGDGGRSFVAARLGVPESAVQTGGAFDLGDLRRGRSRH